MGIWKPRLVDVVEGVRSRKVDLILPDQQPPHLSSSSLAPSPPAAFASRSSLPIKGSQTTRQQPDVTNLGPISIRAVVPN